MEKQAKADQPFFLWYNSTAMHFRTHLADKNRGKSGQDDYSDRMVVHDEQIGMMLDKLDELGIADNTIVMYSTDNGPENDTWPDGANTPFRAQKDTNYEGAWRVPAFLRWPGKIKAGSVLNGIVSHQDMLPTLLALAGDPDVSQKLLNGYTVGDKTFKVHIDGLNQLDYITGQAKESPRDYFFYVSDDGGVMAIRVGDYKMTFEQQRATTMRAWAEPFVKLRLPYITNLRRDPFERAEFNSNTYLDWMVNHVPQLYLAQACDRRPDSELHQVPTAAEGGLIQPRHRHGVVGAGTSRIQSAGSGGRESGRSQEAGACGREVASSALGMKREGLVDLPFFLYPLPSYDILR